MQSIQYLLQHQIDKVKWDECVASSGNGLIYGYSFYLDAIAKNWDAIVLGDYQAVMPLLWNKKYGIRYLYTPPFVQQLGIFSTIAINTEMENAFITLLRTRFKFAELFVNFKTGKEQPNFILPLYQPYDILQKGYKNDLRQNLKHAAKFPLHYSVDSNFVDAIGIYKKLYSNRMPHITALDYKNFAKVCQAAANKNFLLIRKVIDNSNNILAISIFFNDNKRLYNIMPAVNIAGKQCNANHYLVDNLIKEFANSKLILDFEGSSIAGIANFYKKFGAINEPYFFMRYNNLPWPIKYLK